MIHASPTTLVPQITFRNVQASPAVAATIRTAAEKLAQFHPRITRCEVLVEAEHRHQRKGEPFHVRVRLHIPGAEIVVRPRSSVPRSTPNASRRLATVTSHKDMYVAVHDAFDQARRELEDFVRRRRGSAKRRATRASLTDVREATADA